MPPLTILKFATRVLTANQASVDCRQNSRVLMDAYEEWDSRMSTVQGGRYKSKAMWLLKPPPGAQRAKVCCLCAPPPCVYLTGILLALAELILASLVGHIFGIITGVIALLWAGISLFASVKLRPKARTQISILFGIFLVLSFWSLLLVIVRGLAYSNVRFSTFPTKCQLPDGCTR